MRMGTRLHHYCQKDTHSNLDYGNRLVGKTPGKSYNQFMDTHQLIQWLLEGDVSIQYQVQRDLLGSDHKGLRDRIAKEGWGCEFLSRRQKDGHWGKSFYQPKWTSTHYTLLDLKNLGISRTVTEIRQTISMILKEEKGRDGGMNPSRTIGQSDVCVNGMTLNYASYFGAKESDLRSIVDFILSQHMKDGGFNCRLNRAGATHSSMHTTICTLEGFREYIKDGYTYRAAEVQAAEQQAGEFLLQHKLFRSHRTGEVIDEKMLRLSYPSYWHYDILRALDYFQDAGIDFDTRMQDALDVIIRKRLADGTWPVQAKHAGQNHFHMEKVGKPSRWNTLRALRVLTHFELDNWSYKKNGTEWIIRSR
jgi:hypothetical protein